MYYIQIQIQIEWCANVVVRLAAMCKIFKSYILFITLTCANDHTPTRFFFFYRYKIDWNIQSLESGCATYTMALWWPNYFPNWRFFGWLTQVQSPDEQCTSGTNYCTTGINWLCNVFGCFLHWKGCHWANRNFL